MIVVISRLKNSADIIETWVRANAAVADKFVVADNGSVDGTPQILKMLKTEGFDIEIVQGHEELQRDQMNWLLDYVRRNWDPDWILPLDDDEIIASDTIGDIKGYLMELPPLKEYRIRWRVYTMRGNENSNEQCAVKRLGYCFINNQMDFPVVIISRDIRNKNILLTQGNHALKNCDLPIVYLDKLYIAHYPLRSKDQVISKFLTGWSNYLTHPLTDDMKKNSYWQKIYSDFKRDRNCVTDKYLHQIIGLYRQKIYVDNVDEIIWKPANIAEDACAIKYSSSEVDWLYNYMCNTEDIAKRLAGTRSWGGESPFNYDFKMEE
jgi:glycosyltransferase involved in cell wall biosynthesis